MKKILIFELNWLGDILFSFPLIKALKKGPDCPYLACCVVPRYKDLFAGIPGVDMVHTLSDSRGLGAFGESLSFTRMLRKERYDACFILKPSRTRSNMARMAGIGERVGFSGKKSALTREVAPAAGRVHRMDQLLRLAESADIRGVEKQYEYVVGEEYRSRAERILETFDAGGTGLVAINPGGNWDAKRWARENFARLSVALLEGYPDITICVTGAEKDRELADHITARAGRGRCFSLAGLTDLNTLAAVFRASRLVISADSGPLHLASAVGADTVGLFGPTSPEVTGPRGSGRNIVIHHDVGCEVPCYAEDCERSYDCMRSITVDEVLEAAAGILS